LDVGARRQIRESRKRRCSHRPEKTAVFSKAILEQEGLIVELPLDLAYAKQRWRNELSVWRIDGEDLSLNIIEFKKKGFETLVVFHYCCFIQCARLDLLGQFVNFAMQTPFSIVQFGVERIIDIDAREWNRIKQQAGSGPFICLQRCGGVSATNFLLVELHQQVHVEAIIFPLGSEVRSPQAARGNFSSL